MTINWQRVDGNTPKDKPILGWCFHAADPKYGDGGDLTDYGVCCEFAGHVEDGPHVLEWGGEHFGGGDNVEFDDPPYWLPNWWYRVGSDFEQAANPVYWAEITEPGRVDEVCEWCDNPVNDGHSHGADNCFCNGCGYKFDERHQPTCNCPTDPELRWDN